MPLHMCVPDAFQLVLYIDVFGVRQELVDICQRCASTARRDTHMTARPSVCRGKRPRRDVARPVTIDSFELLRR
jgi:hypothetical protein